MIYKYILYINKYVYKYEERKKDFKTIYNSAIFFLLRIINKVKKWVHLIT